MSQTRGGKTGKSRLRALSEWLKGTPAEEGLPARIGHYAVTGKLGQGGMGIVYAAQDERLGRTVALKKMKSVGADETARKRFWREARAAAAVNHPNVCQLYEIGEDGGELFIAMELLEGEALGERLRRGPMAVSEAMATGLGVLAALSALHARGIIHRDLKPSNVFLTPHGVKLLDFGLARASDAALSDDVTPGTGLTGTGMVLGTPRYMAPEQVTGDGLDARSDLFAVGAILFEMLAGRPAFGGKTAIEVAHATLYEQPPALTGSPAVAAVDRVIRRALAKRPAERPASAEAMAGELRKTDAMGSTDDTPVLARALTRLVVLPFRILRADPETDFLAYSLADAIGTSLSRTGGVAVRSSATAARFAGEAPDLKVLATEVDVDRVVMGTLLRSGDQVRASTQLLEAPGGTILSSHTVQSSLGDLFQLQDDIARCVVQALALPLGGGLEAPTPEAPQNASAYSIYLRANGLARTYEGLQEARTLYERAVALDPAFAPAWAQLGRCHRVIGKFIADEPDSPARAEDALKRALKLAPRLSVAHKYYSQIEAETGQPRAALGRLLREASRHGNDPELFAGLCHACRYCGLFEPSVAAHEEAVRLDPNVPTSVEGTLLLIGDLDRLLAFEPKVGGGGADGVIRVIGLGVAGRLEDARAALRRLADGAKIAAFRTYTDTLMGWLDRQPDTMQAWENSLGSLKIMEDPEALFQGGWLLCDAGDSARGIPFLRRAVDKGYSPAATLAGSTAFASVRSDPAFQAVLRDAESALREAENVFRAEGGEALLGIARERGAA